MKATKALHITPRFELYGPDYQGIEFEVTEVEDFIMEDIKIKHNETAGGFSRETNVEVMSVEYGADELAKAILNTFGRAGINSAEVNITVPDTQAAPEAKPECEAHCYNMRAIRHQHITPDILKAAINEENLYGLLHPFDEIDIPLDTGGTVTVVCANVHSKFNPQKDQTFRGRFDKPFPEGF